MSGDAPGRTLRGLVAELAEVSDDDLQMILAAFDGHERNRLLDLISDYRRGDKPAMENGASYDSRFSPWLADRLSERHATGMTPHAIAALRQAATNDDWTGQTPTTPASPLPIASLFARWGLKR